MGMQAAIMQVHAPFSSATGYKQMNGHPTLNVTLVTSGTAS